MHRRSFVAGLGLSFWLPSRARAAAPLAENPFGLGIASGHPTSDSVVLWTRLVAADPTEALGGPIVVGWTIAEDERLQKVVAASEAIAEPAWAHSVHVEVGGLKPNRLYWYRFTVAGKASPIGRTRTTPAASDHVPSLSFSFASCQHYEEGFYTAQRHMAAEELNAVLFVGDYIYESKGHKPVRYHTGGRPTTLREFRQRYALYKHDADLQAVHAAHPWIVMWDDHEVANDYADDISPVDPDPKVFLPIRAAAYQAYWEHMPLPNAMRPVGPAMKLYGRFRYGDLAELHVIDDRQYRAHNACHAERIPTRLVTDCGELLDPSRTMLGTEQEAWFADGMKHAAARWNVVVQQTLMADVDRGTNGHHTYWADGWSGYPMARQKLLEAVAASPVRDTLVLGGDVHSFWATDLKRDFTKPDAPTVATEFVGGSITSLGPTDAEAQSALRANPSIRYGLGGANGYGVMTLKPSVAEVQFRVVETIKQAKAGIATPARFTVEPGRPGVNRT
jgi:alkaline phosphatase D